MTYKLFFRSIGVIAIITATTACNNSSSTTTTATDTARIVADTNKEGGNKPARVQQADSDGSYISATVPQDKAKREMDSLIARAGEPCPANNETSDPKNNIIEYVFNIGKISIGNDDYIELYKAINKGVVSFIIDVVHPGATPNDYYIARVPCPKVCGLADGSLCSLLKTQVDTAKFVHTTDIEVAKKYLDQRSGLVNTIPVYKNVVSAFLKAHAQYLNIAFFEEPDGVEDYGLIYYCDNTGKVLNADGKPYYIDEDMMCYDEHCGLD